MQQRTMVVGVFDDHASAERALQALRDAGVDPSQIGVATLQQDEVVGAAGARPSITRPASTRRRASWLVGCLVVSRAG